MAEVNLPSWSEISQAFEGLQLNSKAATWENILARLARIESRLLEHERRVAATLPPLRPKPDPPDGPPFHTAAQPPYQPPDNYMPLSPYTYATSLLHRTHQPPQPPNNSIGHQPYSTFDAAGQPLFQSTSHQPRYTAGPSPTLHPLPQQPPTLWSTLIQHQQLGFQLYNQPPARTPSCWEPPLTATTAANLPYQNYQPDAQRSYTGKPLTGWPPPPPQHSQSCWCPLSQGRSAAPLPAAAVPISMAKEKSFLSGSILSGMFESDEGIYISGYGSKHQMKKQEGEAFDSSSLDVQIECSCDDARVVDCVRDRGEGEVELCDSKDSIVEKAAKTSMDRESFISNEYYDSDIIVMESDSKLDITIGPYEAYEDTPLGCKATIEAFIGVWNDEATCQLKFEISWEQRYVTELLKLNWSNRMFSFSKSCGWNELLFVIAFDPGGKSSRFLLSSALFVASWELFVASWFPP